MRRIALAALVAVAALMPASAGAQEQAGEAAYIQLHQRASALESVGTAASMRAGIALDTRAVALADSAGDQYGAGMLVANVANAYARLAAMDKRSRAASIDSALAYARDASRRARAARFPAPEIEGLWAVAQVFAVRQLPDSAIAIMQEAADVSRVVKDTVHEIHSEWQLGTMYADLGRYADALPHLRLGMPEISTLDDGRAAAARFRVLVETYRGLRMLDSAAAYAFSEVSVRLAAGDTSGAGEALALRGEVFIDAGELDSAFTSFDDALTCSQIAGDTTGMVLEHVSMAGIDMQRGAVARALPRLRLARQLARAIHDVGGEVDAGIGTANALAILGFADSAVAVSDSVLVVAERAHDDVRTARALQYVARMRSLTGDFPGALKATRRSADLARNLTTDPLTTIELYANTANIFLIVGRVDSASYYAHLAIDAAGDRTTAPNVDWAYLTLGTAQLVLARADSAVIYLQAGVAALRAGGKTLSLPEYLATLARAYLTAGRRGDALAVLDTAAEIARDVGVPAYEARIADERGLALIDTLPAEAAASFERAIALYEQVHNPGMIAGVLQPYAALIARHDPDSALVLLRRAVPMVQGSTDRAGILSAVATTYQLKADTASLRLADAYFDSAMTAFDSARMATGSDENRTNFAETAADVFGMWAHSWLARAPAVGDADAAYAALAVIERGRARGLRELRGEHGGARAGIDPVAEGRAALARVREGKRPTAVLAYTLSATGLIAIAADASGRIVAVEDSLSPDSLVARVRALRRALGVDRASASRGLGTSRGVDDDEAASPAAMTSALQALASELFPAPVRALLDSLPDGTELLLLPQGDLNVVPFASLPLTTGAPLASRFALRFAPSLAFATDTTTPAAATGGALVVGNPSMPTVAVLPGGEPHQLPALPGAGREALAVAKQLHTVAMTGGAARVDVVRQRLPNARVVHLATHGYAFADEKMSRMSFIALAPSGRASGLLTVGDVLYDMPRLRADLVVLSACQTGLGEVRSAEGTIGLQRAFLARGARNVLVSLWSVSDDATELLMTRFYSHWLTDRDHPSKAESLRRAQADVRAVPKFANPVYWAAFQLVGAG